MIVYGLVRACVRFLLYRTFFIRIPVDPHIYLCFQWWVVMGGIGGAVVGCVVGREETQPASCAATSRLCRHLAQTHTPYNASVLSLVFLVPPLAHHLHMSISPTLRHRTFWGRVLGLLIDPCSFSNLSAAHLGWDG